ncbi:D-alanyl-D-alanine carboxypeptidase family protein [Staphylospora marina]|uniref:D-alanyl-D-alanine carboxypeptidase family protein n=1 Tax=Staphylospora marina TaxID=2490858 RepID=UPI001F15342D|nr:D-alanyl-D-alanine carboxypeptidase family protein [Staphylospora marina]
MKRWLCRVLGPVVALGMILQPGHAAATEPDESTPDLAPGARAAILVDAGTGRVLYQKRADEPMPIASLTKIMTAILAIEHGKLDELVTVGPNAVGVEGSSIYLKEGEKIPLETLLYGLMLRSGNDAAVAIAEHIGGSVEGFVWMMNEKAEFLGLEQTHFANPHGLDAEGHHSSARDLATLTAYALKNPVFSQIVSTEVKTVPWPGEQWHRKFYNKNKMLRFYRWADGVKTGFTKKARRTLVSSATKDGRRLITVTLNDGDDWKDSMMMFEYGFNRFETVSILKKGQRVGGKSLKKGDRRIDVVAGADFSWPLTQEEKGLVSVEPIVSFPLERVEKSGMQVGTARVFVKGEQVGSIPLISRFSDEPTVMGHWKHVLALMIGRGGWR